MRATTKATTHRAKVLRRAMSLPEVLLWRLLRDGPIKVRRQHPLGPYVLDFYIPAPRLAIEIDGFSHDTADRPEHDAARDAFVRARGIEVIRIPAKDVLASADDVAAAIIAAAAARL